MPSSPSLPPIRLLIADDHPSVRYGLRSMLEDEYFISEIHDVSSGSQVLDVLMNKEIDVILMDIQMEEGDGITTTKVVSEKYPSTSVIALSMHKEERYAIQILRNGAKGYLLKNADKEVIIDAILQVKSGNLYVTDEISQKVFESIGSTPIKRTKKHDEDLREIIFLICHELTSKEIASIKNYSPRTIEKYRQFIKQIIGTKNVAGVLKYAVDIGIYDDVILRSKFSRVISRSKMEI